jgi:ribosomal protein S18 acetylase RimI-like enzyme
VDTQAFRPPWQLAPEVILRALAQAELVSVAEMGQRIVGYLLATPTAAGAHLARLAVLPGEQGRGLGAALTAHMINHYRRLSAPTLTVNTQATNAASLAVYQRLGFKLTEHKIPVYQLNLSQPSG